VSAKRSNGLLEIIVENPCDPDRPPSRGTGMGIANVRSRVETLCGNRASVDVDAKDDYFRVSILLPATGTATASERRTGEVPA
jgi:LytS/YehU family sensor histidine kinase